MKVKNTFSAKETSKKMQAIIALYGETSAKKLEAMSKQTAPWTDRTGDARRSVDGSFAFVGDIARITLAGGVMSAPYFIYLELAMEKNWATLMPTVERNAKDIFNGYKKVIG